MSSADGITTPTAPDTDAGAGSTPSGGYSLGTGGLIAVIVVVALVVILGIASTVLFVVAKRRQWDIRASIKRASRRFTGRGRAEHQNRNRAADRQSKRAGVKLADKPGHKRGLVVEVSDVEKGRTAPQVKQERNWAQKLMQNDWK